MKAINFRVKNTKLFFLLVFCVRFSWVLHKCKAPGPRNDIPGAI